MELVDVHSHINSNEFDIDRENVLENAKRGGVINIFDSGENLEQDLKVLELSEKYEILRASLGFSPLILEKEKFSEVKNLIGENQEEIAAVGEVGLDYWYIKTESERKKQREIFKEFIHLAKEINKPLVVHSRSAGKYAIELLEKENAEKVCLHAFDGKASNALKAVDFGYYFSIPPSIVRSEQKQKLVRAVPIENLLLESDAPALGPEKGQRNVPENVLISAREIARIKELSIEEVAKITTKNAKELFK